MCWEGLEARPGVLGGSGGQARCAGMLRWVGQSCSSYFIQPFVRMPMTNKNSLLPSCMIKCSSDGMADKIQSQLKR